MANAPIDYGISLGVQSVKVILNFCNILLAYYPPVVGDICRTKHIFAINKDGEKKIAGGCANDNSSSLSYICLRASRIVPKRWEEIQISLDFIAGQRSIVTFR